MPTGQANYQGTHSYAANSILNYVLGWHGTAVAASGGLPEFLRIGGRHIEQPSSATGTLDLTLWLDERGYLNPHIDAITLFSTTTAGTVTTLSSTITVGFGAMKQALVLVDVTGTGGTAPTLDCFVDRQFGGTRWINVARTTLMVGPQASMIILDRSPGTGGQIGSVQADAGAGTVRSVGFGDNFRVRFSVGSNATSQVSFAVYITGIG